MEEVKKLGEMALKLERYRYRIIKSLSWIIFGMLFASIATLCNSLQLFGASEWIWVLLIPTAILSIFLYKKFWMFIPEGFEKKKWKIIIFLLAIPFFIAYYLPPLFLKLSSFYFSIAWYPSLGCGLLLFGLYIKSKVESYCGMTILLTSLIFLALPKIALAANLLGISMMLLIYLACFLYSFLKSQRVIYA